jgi:cell volume regulation protein A
LSDVSIFLLSVGSIFLLGALGELIFQRTNIPDVIWLILAGIGLGPLGGVVSRELLVRIAPFFAAITLVVVLFEGGSALRLSELTKSAPRAALLALVTFLSATLATTLLSMAAAGVGLLPVGWTWTHGLMLGAILGGSSSIVIMPAMAQARIDPRVANLVSLESALTDAFCVVGTTALVDVALSGSSDAMTPALTLGRSFGIALIVGLIAGTVWLLFLRFLHSNEHAYPVTLAALLFLYVAIDRLGGSAAFGILTVAVILGNARSLSQKLGVVEGRAELDASVRGFHRQMAFMIKSFFFVFIGAMLGPPWSLVLLGMILGLMLFLARIPGVYGALLGKNFAPAEKRLVLFAMPRGMAAGVLATLPMTKGVPATDGLPVAVFACVFTTILFFAIGFPLARRALASSTVPSEVPIPAGAARPLPSTPPAPHEPATASEVSPGGGAATIDEGTPPAG